MSRSRNALRRSILRGVAAVIGGTPPPPGPIRRIALLRPDHLGDLVLAAPAIERLRDALPNAAIDLYVGPWSGAVASAIPGVAVRTLPFPGFQRGPKPRLDEPYRLIWREAALLEREAIDLAIILRFDHWWGAALAALAGVPRIVGYRQPDVAPFLTHWLTYQPGRHETIQNSTLVDAAIRLSGGTVPSRPAGRPMLTFADVPTPPLPDRFIVFHPGAGAAVKRWRPSGFVMVAQRYPAMPIVITGGPAEVDLVEEVAAILPNPVARVVGEPLPVLASVLKRALVVIGPDSGVLHLASAVGTPTVRLYGPVDWRVFGPWADAGARVIASTLPCVPCNRLDYVDADLPLHPCIRDIAVGPVLAAVEAALR